MPYRRRFTLLGMCLLAAPIGVVACDGGSTAGTTPTTAQVTVTETATATPSPARPTVTAPPPAPVTTAPAPAPAASAVVGAYFDAINAGDFRAAWDLGGRHFAGSYEAFVAGFNGLAHDYLTVLSSDGRTVTARLDAVQADGTTRVFQGQYTVSGGEIVAAAVHEVGSPKPTATGYPDCTAAHDQGVYDIPRTDPAYRSDQDSDHDGFACEHYGDN
ncbi:excalibur calcium-binding domain-containing protein [Streptomyces sp. RKAG337]|uniref:excalibur calcium-binding domain-containing protein n=1 Tax=Streptomyces sp. RKAG337 TaxID=2893404 RepID=UPI002033CF85|nr:excalibur calcium-binding domain-containing protein [Streptomyces sp. RKAG337]MCM2426424.1 excalibur calcium-binding domain-containing protein [Streptomyces sp. RKAG337]